MRNWNYLPVQAETFRSLANITKYNRMAQKIIYIYIISIVFLQSSHAQNALYFANGNSFPVQLTEATEETVKYTEQKGDRQLKRSFQRENVLLAFNDQGDYLAIAELSMDPVTANRQILEFYSLPASNFDVLIKASPLKVIVGNISYNSEEVINYKTSKGVSGSINKNELALIIHSDGRHEFVMPVEESIGLLREANPEIQKLKKEPPLQASAAKNAPAPTPVGSTGTMSRSTPKPVLNESELLGYREKSFRRVDEFVQYLNIISDKSLDPDEKDKAIDQATRLFLPNATMEVTSNNWKGIKRYPIRDYLIRLKLLPYSSAKIEWHEVNYVSELQQASDGNYYGTISGTQTFTGYGSNGDDVLYSDVTRKSVKVKLQSYQKSVDGQQQQNWEVLLGNIGVAVDN